MAKNNKKFRSEYSNAVRITCIVLASLTVLGLLTTLIYVLL